ncbi:scaffolding protein [Paenibacillus segetis]|uniref:Scaffolding protein n=1 Tax=Paenibacillus segetis TaxID=1325360 RepID=A0ABQ1YAE2_9BACL|nr:scaffolding protein [Paenibacillus segetis]GGH17276.1 hypothetical protein GCM10008013_12510 [Paenibacillus segetis]
MNVYIPSRYPMNLQVFAEDPNPNSDPNPNPDPNDPNKGKTFTQAELDAAVQSRLSRAEKVAQKTLAKDLGYDSVEAMQAALKSKGKEKEDGKLDPAEVDRLVDEKIKAREKEQNDKTFKRLLTAEVKVLANELGFVDWEEAYALADLTGAKEDDKGNITGVKEAMEELLKKKPHLGKQKQGSGRIGANVPNSLEQQKKSKEEIINLAKSRGTVGGQTAFDPWNKN